MIVVRCVRQLANIISQHEIITWGLASIAKHATGSNIWQAFLLDFHVELQHFAGLARWFCASWRLSGFGDLEAKSVGKVVRFGEAGGLRDYSNQRYEDPRMMYCPNGVLKRTGRIHFLALPSDKEGKVCSRGACYCEVRHSSCYDMPSWNQLISKWLAVTGRFGLPVWNLSILSEFVSLEKSNGSKQRWQIRKRKPRINQWLVQRKHHSFNALM